MFHEAIVVLLVGSAAGELNALDDILPEAEQVVVEELTAVVRVDFQHWKGKSGQDTAKGIFHHQVAASQPRYPFTPPGGDIDHL